jgi:flagellar basal body-associated protein FliL
MAEEVEGVEEVEASGGSKMPLVIFAVVAALLAGGGAAYLLLPAPAAEAKPKEKVTVGKILPVDSFIVNLNEAKATRYLKVTISVMLTDESLEEAVKLRMDILRDGVLTYLSGLSIDDVRGSETKELIRERMLELANESLGEGEVVQQVLFKEFVVQ